MIRANIESGKNVNYELDNICFAKEMEMEMLPFAGELHHQSKCGFEKQAWSCMYWGTGGRWLSCHGGRGRTPTRQEGRTLCSLCSLPTPYMLLGLASLVAPTSTGCVINMVT